MSDQSFGRSFFDGKNRRFEGVRRCRVSVFDFFWMKESSFYVPTHQYTSYDRWTQNEQGLGNSFFSVCFYNLTYTFSCHFLCIFTDFPTQSFSVCLGAFFTGPIIAIFFLLFTTCFTQRHQATHQTWQSQLMAHFNIQKLELLHEIYRYYVKIYMNLW